MRVPAMRTLENALRRAGFSHVAGVDEVGRGCLAGPVVAAAVVLNPSRHVPGVSDSKLVPGPERERLFDHIVRSAVTWAVASADPGEIDTLNIHRASLTAMRRAVLALNPVPDMVLVDAFHVPGLPMAQRGVVHGDRRCSAIAAASIVAKVVRDREMRQLHDRDPRYGFDRHKGYATASHLQAVARFGYSPAHRRSFHPSTLFDTMDAADDRLNPMDHGDSKLHQHSDDGATAPEAESPVLSLEEVFAQFRDEVTRRATGGGAEAELARGVALRAAGQLDQCIPALQVAARAPRLRFTAASELGRVYRERGSVQEAIEWFERAAEAPPSTADDGHRLLYELAETLESAGEAARALAVYLELRTEAGSYRDVAARIDRLANARAQG
jgi:ribonuclease HII